MSEEPVVFIVDDDAAFSESLCALVSSMGLKTQSFPSPDEYLEQFNPQSPGVLLLDVRMPKMSGLALQEQLAAMPISPAIIILTGHAEVSTVLRAMRHGAVDFLEKTISETELYDAIQRGIAQDAENRSEYDKQRELTARFAQLNAPEKKVLNHVLHGVSNKRIASHLGISRRTVEDRRARLMQKLRTDTLADLVRLAVEAGF